VRISINNKAAEAYYALGFGLGWVKGDTYIGDPAKSDSMRFQISILVKQ
jgi:hypothetical protein